MFCSCTTRECMCPWVCAHLVRVEVFAWWVDNLSHKGRVLDVFVVAEHVHSILARLCGPVAHVTGPIALVITFNLGLRWTLNRKAWAGKITNAASLENVGCLQQHILSGIFHCVRFLCRLTALLTQCTDVVSDCLHHKVSRFSNNAALQPWTPGPHLLLASLSTNLDLNGTKRSREVLVTVTSQCNSIVGSVSMRVRVPAGDVLSAPGDGDAICSRCGGVILKSIHTISKIFPLTRLLKTLCKHTHAHYFYQFFLTANFFVSFLSSKASLTIL